MKYFDYTTAGESHGPGLSAVIKNIPAGFNISADKINEELSRRQKGYGRGGRMKIEKDEVQILAGIRHGEITGSPLSLFIPNKDFENWKGKQVEDFTRPRPGHADLTGGIKYHRKDLRDILERSSARETAIRVAVGAVAKQILGELGIEITSYVDILGGIEAFAHTENMEIKTIREKTEQSSVRILDNSKEKEIIGKIDEAKEMGDTLGGRIVLLAEGVPPALGSFAVPENKLDARLAFAFMSLQAIKAVEFGAGKEYAYKRGSQLHDEIFYSPEKGFYRKTNRAGGIEGGMSNGERIVLKAVMKPIPTLMKPLQSVDIRTKQPFEAVKERSDVTAVPAAAVVGEGLMAIEILRALLERFGGDNRDMILRNLQQEQTRFEWLD
jgi:chorismate synthase